MRCLVHKHLLHKSLGHSRAVGLISQWHCWKTSHNVPHISKGTICRTRFEHHGDTAMQPLKSINHLNECQHHFRYQSGNRTAAALLLLRMLLLLAQWWPAVACNADRQTAPAWLHPPCWLDEAFWNVCQHSHQLHWHMCPLHAWM